MRCWETILGMLDGDAPELAGVVDWVAKRRLLDGYAMRHGLEEFSPRLKAIDLQYHYLRRDKCLALQVGLERLVVDADDVASVVSDPRFEVVDGPGPRWGARGVGTSVYVSDPDGNTVELRSYT